MKRHVHSCVLALCVLGCTQTNRTDQAPAPSTPVAESKHSATQAPAAAPARTELTVTTTGKPYGLRLEANAVTFCDDRGGRSVDLSTARESASDRKCAQDAEPFLAC